jgi:hypothetical protein
MKNIFLFCVLLFCVPLSVFAQKTYAVDDNSYPLNIEVEGTITLLTNSIDGRIKFFSKKGSEVLELVNTKIDGNYNKEYITVLQKHTGKNVLAVENLKLTLGSLRDFYNEYNKQADSAFLYDEKPVKLIAYLGGFGGLTNSIYSGNETNVFQPKIGLEIELMDAKRLKRHAIVFRLSQTFSNDEQKNNATQLSFNYRFKFVKTEKLNVFINTKVAAYSYINNEFNVPATDTTPARIEETSGAGFDVPIAFGLGAEYRLGNGSVFITYNDAVSINYTSNDEFPADVSLGYKFKL